MTPKKISEKDIREWVSAASFERGYGYFQNGAILDARRQGMLLKSLCEGSQDRSYRVQVTFDEDGISEAHCSCPVGDSGHCKHVAALLLTYLNHHDDFREVEELDTALGQRTKEELIVLIKQMMARRPELEGLLEIPFPVQGKCFTPIDPETYRRQAASAFHRTRYGWGAGRDIADELDSIIDLGNGFAFQGDYSNAAMVFQAVSQEVLSNYEMFNDEEGDLGMVVNSCVEGLAQCLSGEKHDLTVREMILKALFEIYRFDVDFGGVGLGDEVPDIILNHASQEERRTMACQVRVAMPPEKTDSWSDTWHRRVYGGFLLDLEHDTLDDGDYLRICRETGRLGDLVDRLLTLGKHDEAIAEAEKASDYEVLHLADIFVTHGQAESAEHLVIKREKISEDRRVLQWLMTYYDERGDTTAALARAQRLFQMQTDPLRYQQVRDLARKVGGWSELRLQLLNDIANRKQYNVLTRIYLEEGEIDQALENVKFIEVLPWGSNLRIEVAHASEETHPQDAIHLYHQLAESLINARGRDNYRQACAHLSRARTLYTRIGQEAKWTRYIKALRERNRNLRALMDELTKARI